MVIMVITYNGYNLACHDGLSWLNHGYISYINETEKIKWDIDGYSGNIPEEDEECPMCCGKHQESWKASFCCDSEFR